MRRLIVGAYLGLPLAVTVAGFVCAWGTKLGAVRPVFEKLAFLPLFLWGIAILM